MSYIDVKFESFGRPHRIDFPYGEVLVDGDGNRFRLRAAVKQGGNGVVFSGEHLREDGSVERGVAVKLLKQLDDTRVDRFDNEVRILSALDHPRITSQYGHGRARLGDSDIEIPWVAVDLGGPNLREYGDSYGRLDAPTAIQLGIDASEALEHIHEKGIIHRDVKPANFVWNDENGRDHVFMIDLGLAKYVDEDASGRPMDRFTKDNEFVGPVNFSSDELIAYARDKSHAVDHRSDLFQLGKMIWYCMTNEIVAGIPARKKDPTGGGIWSLVCELIQADPDDRPASASVVRDRLMNIKDDL